MPHTEESKSKTHVVYESDIDVRTVICACGNKKCKIGVSFDSKPNVMRLHDKYGNEHVMHLSIKNIKELISEIKGYIPQSNKPKKHKK